MTDRCPSCGATVRPGDPWCTLCWTDLRPAPAPPPAPPAPEPAPALVHAATATLDPLTAPLHALVPGAPPAAPATPATGTRAPTWPCVDCGAHNALDLATCGTCTAPFGGRVARAADPKESRRKVMILALSGVGIFLLLLAAFTVAATPSPKSDSTPKEVTVDGG